MKGKLHLTAPADQSKILWKYLDLHRFIYLVSEQKFFFSRLDKLDDPFEGIAPKLLKLESSGAETSLSGKKVHQPLKELKMRVSQKSQYVNCWFAGERESMAMWNLHSNADAVAIRARYEDLLAGLKPAFNHLISENTGRISVIGKSVKYLKLNPFDEKRNFRYSDFSALKKDKSFEYENEYRFLIAAYRPLRGTWLAVPVELEKLQMKVISHPNIDDWKFKNLQNIIDLCGLNISLEKSPVLIKDHS